jgi:hypothetical protein
MRHCKPGKPASPYYGEQGATGLQTSGSYDGVTPKPASIYDYPAGQTAFYAELCAYCTDEKKPVLLGCVTWGFKREVKGGKIVTIPNPPAGSDKPSPSFLAALEAWEKYFPGSINLK